MKQTGFPNLIIAGAPKCGTSSLFFWLGAHPEVCASKTKETYFLADKVLRHNHNLNIIEHGLEAYAKFFEHCQNQKYRLEATPVYIYHQRPLEILPTLPEVPQVLFIFRRPGDRLYSHWRFNRYRMKNTQVSFADYLQKRNIPKGWKRDYLSETYYFQLLKPWIKALGKEKMQVYQMEQLQANKQAFMQQVAQDLRIDPHFYNQFDFFHRNETVAVKHKKLHRWGLKLEPMVPGWLQEKVIPLYLRLNANKVPPITKQDARLRDEVNAQFEEDSRQLAEVFPNINLDLWYGK